MRIAHGSMRMEHVVSVAMGVNVHVLHQHAPARSYSVLISHHVPVRLLDLMNGLHDEPHRDHAPMPRRRSDLKEFATSMRSMRSTLKIDQRRMAIRMGVSQRCLSDWENGYSQPDVKERLHFIYTINEVDPEWVQTFVGLLGMGDHPAITPLFPEEEPEVAPPASPPPGPEPVVVPVAVAAPAPIEVVAPPPTPAPTREELRALLDSAVREAADVIDVRASDLRRGVRAVLGALAETGASIEDARAALGVKAKERGGTRGGA
jgi:hypothetical protein